MKTVVYTMEAGRDLVRLPRSDRRAVKAAIDRLASGKVLDEMLDFNRYKRFRVGPVLVRYAEAGELISILEIRVSFIQVK